MLRRHIEEFLNECIFENSDLKYVKENYKVEIDELITQLKTEIKNVLPKKREHDNSCRIQYCDPGVCSCGAQDHNDCITEMTKTIERFDIFYERDNRKKKNRQ